LGGVVLRASGALRRRRERAAVALDRRSAGHRWTRAAIVVLVSATAVLATPAITSAYGAAATAVPAMTLSVTAGTKLIVSAAGYKETEVDATDNLTVKLVEENKTLRALLCIFPTLGEKPHLPSDFPWNKNSND
jgi:hypothetical protein